MGNYELSDEEKEILRKMKEEENIGAEKEHLFWYSEYPNYSIDSKVKYWVANIHHGMRQQGDVMGDMYTEFSKKWYLDVKEKEPDFDSIFKEVVSKLDFDFNWDEYYRRISPVQRGE